MHFLGYNEVMRAIVDLDSQSELRELGSYLVRSRKVVRYREFLGALFGQFSVDSGSTLVWKGMIRRIGWQTQRY